jgi:hypothetical protein
MRLATLIRHPRKLIDYWSMPHFLLGTLIAMIVRVFGYPVVPLFFVTLVVAILWEFVEMRLRIREARINVASDIFMPLLAYIVTLWLTGGTLAVRHEELVALLIVTIVFYTLISYAAWAARFDHDPDFLG